MKAALDQQRRFVTLWILRSSIGLSMACIVAGLAIFLAHGGAYVPHTPSGSIATILAYVWQEALGFHSSAFLEAGVLVLLFTPLARLAAGVVANVRLRDWTYALIGLVVVALVAIGLVSGQSGG